MLLYFGENLRIPVIYPEIYEFEDGVFAIIMESGGTDLQKIAKNEGLKNIKNLLFDESNGNIMQQVKNALFNFFQFLRVHFIFQASPIRRSIRHPIYRPLLDLSSNALELSEHAGVIFEILLIFVYPFRQI